MLQPHPGDQQYGEPFFIPFLTGLQAGLAERGLDLIVVMGAPGDYQQERLRRVVEARWADAVVLAWTRREDERIDYLTKSASLSRRSVAAGPAAGPIPRSTSISRRPARKRSTAWWRAATAASPPFARRST